MVLLSLFLLHKACPLIAPCLVLPTSTPVLYLSRDLSITHKFHSFPNKTLDWIHLEWSFIDYKELFVLSAKQFSANTDYKPKRGKKCQREKKKTNNGCIKIKSNFFPESKNSFSLLKTPHCWRILKELFLDSNDLMVLLQEGKFSQTFPSLSRISSGLSLRHTNLCWLWQHIY